MGFILIVVVAIASYFIGVFGFAQIIGSLQNLQARGIAATLLTLLIWGAILIGSWFVARWLISGAMLAYYIPMGISFLQILKSGKVQ